MATVLVIDDEGALRSLLRSLLEGAGHRVLEAADGFEGLALYRLGGVDLVICDLFMPGKNGLEFIGEVCGPGAGAKVIAVSGGACGGQIDLLLTARALGAAAALGKPFGAGDLLRTVEEALAGGAGAEGTQGAAPPARPLRAARAV